MESSARTNVPGIGESSASAEGSVDLENTGERFLPGVGNAAEMSYDHIARYRLVERYVAGKDMIDMGCGAGYGSNSLSRLAKSVCGVDLSGEAIDHAKNRYHAPNLTYQVGDVTKLSFEEDSFEAAVSFEVIEHLPRPEDLAVEAKRVLKEDGIFIVSTPDKQTYSNDRNSVNPFHVKEMYEPEFREILERHFEHVTLYRQGAFAGSLILPGEEFPADGRVTLESAHFSLEDPEFSLAPPATLYIVAVCTNGTAPEPLERPYMILDRDRQIFEEGFDWGITARQIKQYHNYKHRVLAARIHDGNRRLRDADDKARQQDKKIRRLDDQARQWQRQLRRCRNEMAAMQGSRSWRVANRLNAVATRVRNSRGYVLVPKVRSAANTARRVLARVRRGD